MNSCWWIEGDMAHGPNVISFVLVSGDHCWNIIGVYIPPIETSGEMIQYINDAVQHCSTTDPLHSCFWVIFNVNLDNNHDAHEDDIISQMGLLALDDIGDHFPHPCGCWTWSQCRNDHYCCGRVDYILAQDTHEFS